jgi:sulfide:quinone oxidoreductase
VTATGALHSSLVTANIVVVGGGTGGTSLANRLRRRLRPADARITVIDRDDRHLYQPGLLFVPFGLAGPRRLVRSRSAQLQTDIEFLRAEVDHVDLDTRKISLGDDTSLAYDALVIASGAVLAPGETDGLLPWSDNVHTFYDLEGAQRLAAALARFEGGRIAVNLVDMPIKCPVAPLEFCFLADWYFTQRGIRDRVEIAYVTPLDSAFTKPACARALGGLLEERRIELVTEFNTGSVEGEGRRLVSYDEREVGFDLAVVVPLHAGAPFVARSEGLGDALGFVPVDQHTLQSKARPEVFALGDGADLPTSKAGSAAHFQGEVLVDNVVSQIRDEPPAARYDGHTNCFIETGFGKALLIDFNYETEPLPGRFPGRFGLPLLAESRLNHLGKLLFEQIYWHAILPGRALPGIGHDMPERGKLRYTTEGGA